MDVVVIIVINGRRGRGRLICNWRAASSLDVVIAPLLIIGVIAGLVISTRLNGGGLRELINLMVGLWIVATWFQRCDLNGTASILLIV